MTLTAEESVKITKKLQRRMEHKYGIQKQTTVTFQFPEPPAGEEWHNPEGASAAEVGEGYRLLTKHEQKLIQEEKIKLENIWLFDAGGWRNGSAGVISSWTYRVPDTTPITLSRLQYNPNKFYGAEDKTGHRYLMAHDGGNFVMTKNPSGGEYVALMSSFESWQTWLKKNNGEIKEFGTLLELANWMEGK